jgi:hypothetical protein
VKKRRRALYHQDKHYRDYEKESAMKLNAKYVVFSLFAVASTYVLYHNERFLVDSSNPVWQHYEPIKWWLLPHGCSVP